MSAQAFNPYNHHQTVNSQASRTNQNPGSFYGQVPKNSRVLHHNATGKPVDKLTGEQTQHNVDPLVSIYNQDFGGKVGNNKKKAAAKAQQQSGPSSVHGANPANGKQSLPANKNNTNAHTASVSNIQSHGVQHGDHGVIHVTDAAHQKPHVTIDETKHRLAQTADSVLKRTNYSVYDVEAVHGEVKRNYGQNPKIKHDEEAEYYETVRRLDVCGHCWTDQRKYASGAFNPMHKTPGVSLYTKDYVKHPITDGPVMKNDFYTTFNIPEPIDFGTTMANDYKPWNAQAPERPKPVDKSAASGVPFAGKSGYKAEFINWGNMPVNFEKAPHNLTTIKELPFMAKTAYQDSFAKPSATDQAKPLDRDLWNTKKKSPISSGIPFLGMTTTATTYKPYKVGGAPMFNVKDDYEPTEAYPGQFNSTYHQDYKNNGNGKCPARVFMDTHTNPRAKTVKS